VLRKGHILVILVIGISTFTVLSISAQESQIPSWIKTTVGYWINGDASDQDFINAIKWMLENKILKVSTTQDNDLTIKVNQLSKENERLEKEVAKLKAKNAETITEKYANADYGNISPHDQTPVPIDKEFSAGPFRFHVIDAGYVLADENGKTVEYYQVNLEATNKRGTSVKFYPSAISLTDSSGYGLQHKYTNGLQVGSGVSPGSTISGFYTFDKPSQSGNLKLFIEMAIYEDSGLSYNWHYSGEVEWSTG